MIEAIVDSGRVPDTLMRAGIRRVVAGRLREQSAGGAEASARRLNSLLGELRRAPIARDTQAANAQHYEVPAAFFTLVLGPRLKYSSAYWPDEAMTLGAAEDAMLALTAARADLADGQRILELGCGWGSLTLYMAEHFPHARITGVSNSASQRAFILQQAAARGLSNVDVVTADINAFVPDGTFDRIVSVEMLEHVRNHRTLFARIASWLRPDGRFFAHVFAHRQFAYTFEDAGRADWMARHFFTGGMMPSAGLFFHLQDDLEVEAHWNLPGTHYERTANAWLANLDARRQEVEDVLAATYGRDAAPAWRARWRVFFMACAEMFGYRDGGEWVVSHYRFKRRNG